MRYLRTIKQFKEDGFDSESFYEEPFELYGDEPEFDEDDIMVDPMGTDLADFEDEITDDMDVSEEGDIDGVCDYCGENPKEDESGLCIGCHSELYGGGEVIGDTIQEEEL